MRWHLFLLWILFFCPNVRAQGKPSDIEERTWGCMLNLETQKTRKLFELSDLASVSALALSPDRQRLAFSGTDPVTQKSHVWVSNIDGGARVDLGLGMMPTWSPRGKRIAFTNFTEERGVWILHTDGSNRQLLDKFGRYVQWSPTGRMLAYTHPSETSADVVIFNPVEDDYTSIFSGDPNPHISSIRNFAWSPNSRRVCFKARGNNGDFLIASVAVIGDTRVRIHLRQDKDFSDQLSWLNDSTIVAALWSAEHNTEQLFAVATDSGPPTTPIRIAGQMEERRNGSVDVSRNGRTLVYLSQQKPQQ